MSSQTRSAGLSSYRRRLYSVIAPFLKNTILHDLTTTSTSTSTTMGASSSSGSSADHQPRSPQPPQLLLPHQQRATSLTSAFRSLRAGGKKWWSSSSQTSASQTQLAAVNAAAQHSLMHAHHPHSTLNLPLFSLESTGSAILGAQQLGQLWRWLPARYQILELELIYSTDIHGCRLMTLMDKCEFYPASVIVVLTTTNSVFGAYCSQPWSMRITQNR